MASLLPTISRRADYTSGANVTLGLSAVPSLWDSQKGSPTGGSDANDHGGWQALAGQRKFVPSL